MPPRGAGEMSRRSRKWTRDHASHAVRSVEQFAGDRAHSIELLDGDYLFVRGDLKNAVAGGIHNRLTCADMLVAELLDDFRARCRFIPERSSANLHFKFRN